jgi:hypothetical protein
MMPKPFKSEIKEMPMYLHRIAACLFALVVLAGCASTRVTARQPYEGDRIPRPDRIIVHDFAATPADVPAGSAVAGQYAQHSAPQSAEEINVGRQLGAQVAKELVAQIRGMGLPAVQAAGQPTPRIGDIVIMGYFESVDSGSAAKRIVLGFGSGAAHLNTAVEVYLMTDKGLRRLGSGDVESGGGKTPGVAVPLVVAAASGNPIGLIVGGAVKAGGEVTGRSTIEGAAKQTAKEIGDQLQVAFQKQGWI